MYSVSADYLTALSAPVKRFRLSGSVGSVSFTQANVVSGSLQITNKCSEGSEIKIGSVYTGQLKCTFTGLNIARGSWNGKVITLSEGLQLADETYEDVPLGVFIVSKANHTTQGVEVTAYDAMTAFDKSVSFDTTTGTAYELLDYICTQRNITLENTQASIEAMPNGTEEFEIYPENDIETFRDLLFWIVQSLGAIATINRSGHLEIRQYSTTSAATIDESQRFAGCSFSDFVTKYTGMSVVDIAEQYTRYFAVNPDDGLTYNLGSNPLLQFDIPLVQNIIDAFSAVELTPFKASMLGGAIYDLGDCLTFSGGIAQGAVCGVMAYSYKYNGGYEIEGFGENPALANARSKTDHDISGLMSTVSGDAVVHFTYTNAENVSVTDGGAEQEIIHYHIYASGATWFALNAEIKYTGATTETVGSTYIENDLVVTAKYYLNETLVGYTSVETEQDGVRLLHLDKTFSVPSGGVTLSVTLSCSGGSASVSAGDGNALLWGQKIEANKIVNIVVATLPPNNFNYGVLNYDGLVINGVYTDGTTENITSACTLTPSAGTSISGDATEISARAEYTSPNLEEFSVDYDIPVESLYRVYEGSTVSTHTSRTAGEVEDIDGDVWTLNYYSNVSGTTKTVRINHTKLGHDADLKPSPTLNGTLSVSFVGPRYTYGCYISDNKLVVDAGFDISYGSTVMQPAQYFDMTDGSTGSLPFDIVYKDYEAERPIVWFNETQGYYPGVLDDYIIYPKCSVEYTDGNSTKTSYGFAYGKIQNGKIALTFVNGNLSDTAVSEYKYTLSNSQLLIDRKSFDTTNYLTSERILTLDATGWHSVGARRINNTNKYIVYDTSNSPLSNYAGAYLVDYDTDTATALGAFTTDDDFYNKAIHVGCCYHADQGVYVNMDSSYRETHLYFSYDLLKWYKSGYMTTNELSGLSQVASDGECLVGTGFDGSYSQKAFTAVFNIDLTE